MLCNGSRGQWISREGKGKLRRGKARYSSLPITSKLSWGEGIEDELRERNFVDENGL
jgi:hypothetical protein